MKDAAVRQLVEKYLDNTLSAGERQQLLSLTEDGNNAALMKLFQEMLADEAAPLIPVDEERLRQSLMKVLEIDKPTIPLQPETEGARVKVRGMRFFRTAWVRYAAAVILVAGIGTYVWLKDTDRYKPSAEKAIMAAAVNDIDPGGQKAVLTLANGTAILLDSAANGQLATQQGSSVIKKDGQVIYTPVSSGENLPAYNTLRTPRGGTYQLCLPDGTKVWLNAESAISYPVAFSGKERLVEMTGEAFFEVAPHAQLPFKVRINKTNLVEVLGTQFNVKAYAEEEVIRTTLLEGAVRVASNGDKLILKPGQQARASAAGLLAKTLGQEGISETIAWKEGLFNFQDANLQEIMRQLSRWYDIEVVYEKGIPDLEFIGEIERSLPLSEVLKGLKMSGVHFRLEKGKRLVVSP
jgi:ferric-dicitrate binding protein FerR (iron transport regulator)